MIFKHNSDTVGFKMVLGRVCAICGRDGFREQVSQTVHK